MHKDLNVTRIMIIKKKSHLIHSDLKMHFCILEEMKSTIEKYETLHKLIKLKFNTEECIHV